MASPVYYSPEKAIRRVTVRQLLCATQLHSSAPFQIDGKGFKLAVLVGNPYDITGGSGFISFTVDDGTGRIRVQQWTERGTRTAQVLQAETPSNSPHVRVVGELRTYMNTNCLAAHNVFTVESSYEVFGHILGAIADSIAYEKGPPHAIESGPPKEHPKEILEMGFDSDGPSSSGPTAGQYAGKIQLPADGSPNICSPISSMTLEGAVSTAPMSQSAVSAHGPAGEGSSSSASLPLSGPHQNPYLSLSSLQRVILQCTTDLVADISPGPYEALEGPHVRDTEFGESLSFLLNQGYIYRPISNSHFMSNV
ncbi:hypothetical protein B0H10DRAFT_2106321 [Mycena sp. CBHHK59/15]|nr:hypothetical protein B0H10DRAFT_2106321 [Mycena sp. CBHHK59/15]